MTINFIICRIIKRSSFVRVRSMHIFAFHYPDADPFHPTRIDIPGILDSHCRIDSMQTAYMFMIQTLLASDKYSPEWPAAPAFSILIFHIDNILCGLMTLLLHFLHFLR